MSHFRLLDEVRDRFAPLQKRRRLHADAFLLYGLLGQLSARRTTDGEGVTDLCIRGELPNWTKRQRVEAAAALVAIGLWRVTEDGWAFVDWDIGQATAESEQRRRAEAARRQRERRARLRIDPKTDQRNRDFIDVNEASGVFDLNAVLQETPRKTQPVTRDVPRDVTPAVALTRREEELRPPPTGAPCAAPADAAPESPNGPITERKPRGPRKPPTHRAEFARILEAEASKQRFPLPDVPLKQRDAAMKLAEQAAELDGVPFALMAARVCQEAIQATRDGRKSALRWALVDWQPGGLPGPFRRAPRRENERPENLPPPAKMNVPTGTKEDILAVMMREKAEKAARTAALLRSRAAG